ncbi:MAG TPA: insulinase family protein [Allosphingosinicella sp.]|nr:insulinase family protein [Allosphingosinicella sp.]
MTFLRSCFIALLVLCAMPLHAQLGDSGWFYRGSDIPPDPAWRFGTLPNGVRYALRRNALPAGQVSIRVRIDAGSLHEQDHERGWAHLVEHMAFRANKAFADREARHLLEKLGVSFGGDSNASTSPTQTVYMLDLPNADREKLDTGLHYLSEALDSALFESAAVDAERKIVLEEKGRRPELAARMQEVTWPLFYAGLKMAERDPIGTEAALKGATSEGLRAFYERWYRPDRATVVIAGDADPELMEELVAKHFGDWQASGPAPQEPDYGRVAEAAQRTATVAYPGAPHSVSLVWIRPYEKFPNTKAREKVDMARSLAERIVNRRLEAKARGEASFVSAGVNEQRQANVADMTSLFVSPRDGKWREALAESFAIISDAVRAPPSAAEINREISNMRAGATAAVEAEGTVRSQQRVQQLVSAIDGNSVVATAAASLQMINEFAPQMTPATVGAAMRDLFKGSGPRMTLLGPAPIPVVEANAALATAEKAAPATRQAERNVSFADIPPLGPEGREVSRQRIADMGVTIVRFANGSSLTFKQTDFDKGTVQVALRFGKGLAGLPPDKTSLHTMGGIVSASGIANLDLDAMERLLTGRRISMNFGVGEDALVLRGLTNRAQLGDQLRLLASKLAFPRWDAPLFARMKTGVLQNYDLAFASASARFAREFGGFAHNGDKRWMLLEKETIQATSLADLQAFFDPLLAKGPINAIIVGDVDLETAVAAMKKTVAALPPREPVEISASSLQVRAPAPNSTPTTFTHRGDPNQAAAVIGWTTFGGLERTRERRALSVAANIFQARLFEELREVEGASYSPSARSVFSSNFPDWGIFYASSELRPENAATFFRIARGILSELAAKPVSAEEFERAQNPILSGIERSIKTNGYWMGALEDWTTEPRLIEQTRSYLSDYRSLTPEEVRAAVAAHVADAGDWSMLVLPAKARDRVD